MISIKECTQDWEDIKKTHCDYAKQYAHSRVDFYIDVYSVLSYLDFHPRIRKRTVNNRIISIGKKHNLHGNHVVSLIGNLFIDRKVISDCNRFFNLKFSDMFIAPARNIDGVFKSLVELKARMDDLIEFEAPINIINYKIDKVLCDDASFLFNAILDYKAFSNKSRSRLWNAYNLANALNLKSCAYCNRQYTFTVSTNTKEVTRPELDHFYEKAGNPLLALSFENLIPSCSICNGDLKGEADFINKQAILNPYEENKKHSSMTFNYYPRTYEAAIGLSAEIDIEIDNREFPGTDRFEKVKEQIKLFKYKEIYSHHSDYVQDLIVKKWISNNEYLILLMDLYDDFDLSKEEAYKLAFGNFYNERDFSQRPLAKLTKDIAEKIGLLP